MAACALSAVSDLAGASAAAAPSDLADLSASAEPLSSADASALADVPGLAASADSFVSAEVSAFAGASVLDTSDLSDFPASAEASGFAVLSALVEESGLLGVCVLADVSVLPGFAVSVVASGFAEVSGLAVSPASGTGQPLNGSRNFESEAARALSGAAASETEITREKIPAKATDARFRFMGGSLSSRQVRLYNAIVLARQAQYQSLWATATDPDGTLCPIRAQRRPRAPRQPHAPHRHMHPRQPTNKKPASPTHERARNRPS